MTINFRLSAISDKKKVRQWLLLQFLSAALGITLIWSHVE